MSETDSDLGGSVNSSALDAPGGAGGPGGSGGSGGGHGSGPGIIPGSAPGPAPPGVMRTLATAAANAPPGSFSRILVTLLVVALAAVFGWMAGSYLDAAMYQDEEDRKSTFSTLLLLAGILLAPFVFSSNPRWKTLQTHGATLLRIGAVLGAILALLPVMPGIPYSYGRVMSGFAVVLGALGMMRLVYVASAARRRDGVTPDGDWKSTPAVALFAIALVLLLSQALIDMETDRELWSAGPGIGAYSVLAILAFWLIIWKSRPGDAQKWIRDMVVRTVTGGGKAGAATRSGAGGRRDAGSEAGSDAWSVAGRIELEDDDEDDDDSASATTAAPQTPRHSSSSAAPSTRPVRLQDLATARKNLNWAFGQHIMTLDDAARAARMAAEYNHLSDYTRALINEAQNARNAGQNAEATRLSGEAIHNLQRQLRFIRPGTSVNERVLRATLPRFFAVEASAIAKEAEQQMRVRRQQGGSARGAEELPAELRATRSPPRRYYRSAGSARTPAASILRTPARQQQYEDEDEGGFQIRQDRSYRRGSQVRWRDEEEEQGED